MKKNDSVRFIFITILSALLIVLFNLSSFAQDCSPIPYAIETPEKSYFQRFGNLKYPDGYPVKKTQPSWLTISTTCMV